MSKPFRPRRDFDGMEARRKQAARLFASGRLNQSEIARRLGVSSVSVHRWFHAWRRGGTAALRKAGRAGRKPRLEKADLKLLDRALRDGALAYGFSTELWTLPRVARVIEEITGVHYHPGHVWRILREGLNWSLQRPTRRAKERDEKAIQRWVAEDWPRVKKTPAASGPGSSSRTRAESASGRQSAAPGHPGARPRS
jgi:transposase